MDHETLARIVDERGALLLAARDLVNCHETLKDELMALDRLRQLVREIDTDDEERRRARARAK